MPFCSHNVNSIDFQFLNVSSEVLCTFIAFPFYVYIEYRIEQIFREIVLFFLNELLQTKSTCSYTLKIATNLPLVEIAV